MSQEEYPPKSGHRRARPPKGYYLSPPWRAALREINRQLADESSQLAQAFDEAEELVLNQGEIAASAHLQALIDDHRDLFPGEAGERLAWSILCDEAPGISANGENWQIINVFELNQPAPPLRRGNPGHVEQDERVQKLLDYLAEPLTFTEIAKRFAMTSRELHRWFDRLKKQQHLELPDSRLQRFYAAFDRTTVPPTPVEPDVDCPFCNAALGDSDLPCWRCRTEADSRADRWQQIKAEQTRKTEVDAKEYQRVANLNTLTRHCPCGWSCKGTPDDARALYKEHRRQNHE